MNGKKMRFVIIKGFKAKYQTHLMNKNQKIWVYYEYPNFIEIVFKQQGDDKYIWITIDKWGTKATDGYNKVIGDKGLQDYKVTRKFAERLELQYRCIK